MNRNPLFFCNVEEKNKHEIIQQFQKYSEEESKQVYVIDKFLGTNIASDYEIDNVIIILIPKHPILLLSFGKATEEELDDFLGNVDIKTTQELMRHSNFNTTMSLYTHINDEHKQEVINQIFAK